MMVLFIRLLTLHQEVDLTITGFAAGQITLKSIPWKLLFMTCHSKIGKCLKCIIANHSISSPANK